jgi:hypothetical protein
MDTKRCFQCRRKKPLTEFYKIKRSDHLLGFRYDSRCKKCSSARFIQYEKDHREQLRPAREKRSRDYRERNRAFIKDYLTSHPCVDCGESDVVVLQFDHVRGGRRKHVVTAMAASYHALDSIKKEIAKCDVRCANCHVRRHRLASQIL